MKKAIYLDWNIFQDMIQNRRGEGLRENLYAAEQSGYIVVYSGAHMRDLSRCSNEIYVKKDLHEVSKITKNWFAGLDMTNNSILYERVSPDAVFSSLKNDKTAEGVKAIFEHAPYNVDMSGISENNILFPYLIRYSGIMSKRIIDDLFMDIGASIMSDHNLQKQFRRSLHEVIGLKNPAVAALLDMPIYQYLLSSKDDIKDNLRKIVESFFCLSNKAAENVPIGEIITTSYNILDFFPAFSERLSRRNNQNNISTDAEHVFMASSSHFLVCGDNNMMEKAGIIYDKYGINTRICDLEGFLRLTFVQT